MKFILRYTHIIFLLIIFLAIFIRIFKLGEIPNSLNPDETALGYNAFSILKTGADEHGVFLPLSLESFGDWKLPVYSYIDVVPIKLLGLTEFSVRLPSALAGIVGVFLIYKISLLLFKNKNISLLASLFFAVSPWSIYFSRAAYEVNVATALFLVGFFAYTSYIYKKKKDVKLIFLAFVLFGLTLFTQHNYIVFTPLFVFASLVIFRKSITFNRQFIACIFLLIIIICVSYISLLHGGSKKISNLNIFNDKNIIYSRVEKLRGDNTQKNIILEHILYTKYLGVTYQIGQNYINSFSPAFLFDKGGEKLVHNIGEIGYLYLLDSLFLVIGFAYLFWNKEKSLKILLIWLVLAPIPSAITTDTPNSTRLFTFLPALILVSAYGAYHMLLFLSKRKGKVFSCTLLSLLFIVQVIYFFEYYFVHFNYQRIRFWHYGYKQAVELTQQHKDLKVVMTGPENFDYIYFLFYEKYDPQKFRNEVAYYPYTNEGFRFVKSFDKYEFVEKIDYDKTSPNNIYIDSRRLDDKNMNIYLPNGDPIFGYTIQ